ncbi:EamA family transporter [Paenibacillus caui]|uniref:EamA family transporter n=1 Tax=Paenibacillus caui TaxID=2873927 RepID=UPI001CA837E4|nr:EamA family transporter [Paenibacillus caui]
MYKLLVNGKSYMIFSSLFTAIGQLYWKWGSINIFYLILGFGCYGISSIFMFKSFSIEKLSVAYPLLSTSYIFALLIGYFFLHESIDYKKIIAVILLITGIAISSYDK